MPRALKVSKCHTWAPTASDDTPLPENKIKNWAPMSATLTDGADNARVARCDWLLVNVQQTEMLQEGVGHAGVQLLALDEGVR